MRDHIVISCEHGGRRIPPRYRSLFERQQALLDSHRGWDLGALVLAKEMALAFGAPLFASTTSRLLIDLNRSIGHPDLYSQATRDLPRARRAEIVARYYRPHRERIEVDVRDAIGRGERVVHIASHSFTPELNGTVRDADIGLLYNPARTGELTLALYWLHALTALRGDLRVRRNYPYAGKADGLTAFLRRTYSPAEYVGIELEVNQKHVLRGGSTWKRLRIDLISALCTALAQSSDPTS